MNRGYDDQFEQELADLLGRVEGPTRVPDRTRVAVLARMSSAFEDEISSRHGVLRDQIFELTPTRPAQSRRRPAAAISLAAAVVLMVIGGTILITAITSDDSNRSTTATSPIETTPPDSPSHGFEPFRLDAGSSWVYRVTAGGEQTGRWQFERVADDAQTVRMTWSPDDADPSRFNGTFARTGGSTSVPLAALLANLTPSGCRDMIAISVRAPEEFDTAVRIEAECDEGLLAATGTAAWNGAESVTTPAGQFLADRLDIELRGFEPFPLTVTMWFDADLGLIAQQLTSDDGTQLTRLDLIDVTET